MQLSQGMTHHFMTHDDVNKDCIHNEPEAVSVQYGQRWSPHETSKNKLDQLSSRISIASILVQMDTMELTRYEVAEYPISRSDLRSLKALD